jgi:mono/diheme cytochrome c family protein
MKLAITVFVPLFLAASVLCARNYWQQEVPPQAQALENPYAADPSAAAAGEKLYRRYCAACHGEDAQGIGHTPALRTLQVERASPGTLFWLLRNGKLDRGMPSWSKLPDQQRWQIVTYLKILPGRTH